MVTHPDHLDPDFSLKILLEFGYVGLVSRFSGVPGEISRRRPTAAALHWPKQTLALIKSDQLGAPALEPLGDHDWLAITPSCLS